MLDEERDLLLQNTDLMDVCPTAEEEEELILAEEKPVKKKRQRKPRAIYGD